MHIALYIKRLSRIDPQTGEALPVAKPTKKQHLAAIRKCFDWLVVNHILSVNPASVVAGHKHVMKKGKTLGLAASEARQIIDGIRTDTIVGLRDRAIITLMGFTFARVGAVVAMNVSDVYTSNCRLWVRLHEKGDKEHAMPAHHELEEYLLAYLEAIDFGDQKNAPLFRASFGKTKMLTENRLDRRHVHAMIRRRAKDVGILSPIGCHSWRKTGITDFMRNGGLLEHAQRMANHSSPRTTKLYDESGDDITLDEVELIRLR